MNGAKEDQAAQDHFAALSTRLSDEAQRALLRALLDRLAEGGGVAVREEVQRRLRAILGEDG